MMKYKVSIVCISCSTTISKWFHNSHSTETRAQKSNFEWPFLPQYLFAGEHLNLTAMMNTWTLQKGIPLVTVARNGSRLLLRQERFLKAVVRSDPDWATLQRG